MLVLTRKHQEQIRIGDNITVTILKVKGSAVRIGIEAPRDIRVIRGELPTFESMEKVEVPQPDANQSASIGSEHLGDPRPDAHRSPVNIAAEDAEEESSVSELEWVVMKKLSRKQRKACLPVRSCLSAKSAPPRESQPSSTDPQFQVVAS